MTGETLTTTEKVSSALVKLKASAKAVLDAVPGQQSQDSSITLEMIDTLHNDLVNAKTEWRKQVGEAKMHYYSNNRLQHVYEPAPGEGNMVIYEVTKLIADCLTYLENIKAVLPTARAEVLVAVAGVGGTGASMHALLRQLDALK